MSWLLSPIGSIASLDVVADVTLSAIGAGELLQWNGSAWINQTLAEIGVGTGDAVKADNETITGNWTFPATGFTVGATALTETKVGQWDTAYGWGDHAGLYSVLAHTHAGVYEPVDATIVRTGDAAWNATDWDTAFGWGDWSGQGFLTSVAISDLDNGTDGELITWSAAGVATTVPVGTSTHVLTSNGVGAAPTFQAAAGGGAAAFVTKYKTADESVTSSTTYQVDDHLAGFAMDNASYYKVEACLYVTGHTSGDMKAALFFTNAVQSFGLQAHVVTNNGGHNADAAGTGTVTSVVIPLITSSFQVLTLTGFIKSNATTGGTFDLNWAQNVSNATATTVKDGSWMTLTKIS